MAHRKEEETTSHREGFQRRWWSPVCDGPLLVVEEAIQGIITAGVDTKGRVEPLSLSSQQEQNLSSLVKIDGPEAYDIK